MENVLPNTIEFDIAGFSGAESYTEALVALATDNRQADESLLFDDFLLQLIEDFNSEGDALNTEFVESDEFEHFIRNVFSKAVRARQKIKFDAYRSILLRTVTSSKPDHAEAEDVASLVHVLQDRHLSLLKILHSPLDFDHQYGPAVGSGGNGITTINEILGKLLPGWSLDEIERAWWDLYDAGIHRTRGTLTLRTDRGIRRLENRLTVYGRVVARYIFGNDRL